MGLLLLILAILILMALWQMLAIVIFWRRFSRRLHAQEPSTATLIVHALGPDQLANSRVLARYTRLDISEIDEFIAERQSGPLPLPLSWRRANLLATELRRLGGDAEVEPR
jgi:hypothetical protein